MIGTIGKTTTNNILNPDLQELQNIIREFIKNPRINHSNDCVNPIEILNSWTGAGIVTVSGGITYLVNTYISLKYIRRILNSSMPIEVWHLGKKEIDSDLAQKIFDLGNVKFIDALEICKQYPFKPLSNNRNAGWELKSYSIFHSTFKEILYIDADCFLYQKPEKIFNTDIYREYKALFSCDIDIGNHVGKRNTQTLSVIRQQKKRFQDINKHLIPSIGIFNKSTDTWDYSKKNPLWDTIECSEDDMPEFESGFIMIDKFVHYKPLMLARLLNEHSDITYNYTYGDKDTFHLALAKYNHKYNIITDLQRNNICISGKINGDMLFEHRVLCGKYSVQCSINEFPNNAISHSHTIHKKYLLEAMDIYGNDILKRQNKIKHTDDSLIFDYIDDFIHENNPSNILDIGGGCLSLRKTCLPNTDYKAICINIEVEDKSIIQDDLLDISNRIFHTHYDLILVKHFFQNLSNHTIQSILKHIKCNNLIIIEDNPTGCQPKNINRGQSRPVEVTKLFHFSSDTKVRVRHIGHQTVCYEIQKSI